MILSNSTQNSNMTKLVYQRSINSLADTLWNKSRSNHDLRLVVVQENKNSITDFSKLEDAGALKVPDYEKEFFC